MAEWLVAYELLIAAVVLERGAELVLSRRHARALFARGAVERGRGHYPAMVALHTALLVGCALEPRLSGREIVPAFAAAMLCVVLLAQGRRSWSIASLGVHWNTRVIVLPGSRRITGGPYRWLSHPNYVAVVAEGAALPLVASSWMTALVFTVLNAWLLRVRVRAEDAALREIARA